MIDHLLWFESRGAAEAHFGGQIPDNAILNVNGPNDESVRVILQEAVFEGESLISPAVMAEGWYCIIAEPAMNESLRDLPNTACRLIADREKAAAQDPGFLLYVAPDLPQEVLSAARIEPTPAGSQYPFSLV